MNLKKIISVTVFLITLFGGQNFAGEPTFFPILGSKTFSLNGMYFAGIDGSVNITSNPAGLAELRGKSIEFSGFARLGQVEYRKKTDEVFRSFRDDDFGMTLGAYWNISENFTVGLDYNGGQQYRINWPFTQRLSNDSGSVLLAFDHLNEFSVNSINPALAYDLGSFSLGLTANIMQVNHSLSFYQGNARWNDDVGRAAYQVSYEQDGWAYGFTIGARTELSEKVDLGLVIKSGVSTSMEGDARTGKFADLDSAASKAAVSSTFELPWELGLGGVYNLSDNFTLNIDFLYNLWASTQETLQFDFDNQLWNERLSNVDSLSGYTGSEFLLKFKNSFNLGFGIEYSAPSNIKVRFGYRYSQTPNENETYNMLFPSVDQHWISTGLGFRFEELYIDASLAYASGVETEISKNDNFFYGGNYNMDTFLPTVKIKYEF